MADSTSLGALTLCPYTVDNSFGPWAGYTCRGGFDFTLLFEESILSIPVLSLFFISELIRLPTLARSGTKVSKRGVQLCLKLILAILVTGLQLSILVIYATTTNEFIRRTKATIPTAGLAFVASLEYVLLSYMEHVKAVRPSFVINIYLFFSVLLDLARTRTLWLLHQSPIIPTIFTVAMGLRCLMVVVESLEKRVSLVEPYSSFPSETLAGTFSNVLFLWLAPLLRRGYRQVLSLSDLDQLDPSLASELLRSQFTTRWNKVKQQKVFGTLFTVCLATCSRDVMHGAIARAALIGFTFAQPFIINQAVVLASAPKIQPYNNYGYGLIGAFIIVYTGIAISNVRHEYKMYRVAVMMRGALIPAIFVKTLQLDAVNVQPAAALTLISTDIEVITNGVVQFHENWASFVEIGLAIWLIYKQLGPACGVPAGIVVVNIFFTVWMAVLAGPRQSEWNEASQVRVSRTASTIGAMKWIKFSGLTVPALKVVEDLRWQELLVSRRFRKVLIWITTIATVGPILLPFITLSTFAGLAARNENTTLTIQKAFTAFSLFLLLTKPVATFVIALPTLAASLASFARIQEYLTSDPRSDARSNSDSLNKYHCPQVTRSLSNEKVVGVSTSHLMENVSEDESKISGDSRAHATGAEIIASMHGKLLRGDGETPVIDIDGIAIRAHVFTLLLGPVGCGKTTVLRCLLGEIAKFEGEVKIDLKDIAFCEQAPWLPNGRVKDVITMQTPFDLEWYDTVTNACALSMDFTNWPSGDGCIIGSRGVSLSGGQKQRIALARAVYSRRRFVILDDIFKGLDPVTEHRVYQNLLGPEGLLRKHNTTILLASSDARHVPDADHVVVLNAKGAVEEQAPASNLTERAPDVERILQQSPEVVDKQESTKEFVETTDKRAPLQDQVSKVRASAADAELEAQANRRTGDSTVYKYYLKSAGLLPLLIFLAMLVVLAFCDTFPTLWLKWWADYNLLHPNGNLGKWLGVYAALSVGAVIGDLIAFWELFIVIITKSGKYFHSQLVHTVSNAPMSLFSTIDTGLTINRFSQDIQLIDMELPSAALGVALAIAYTIAQAVFMSIASKYMAIVFPFVVAVTYFVQRFYLRTSRQMRFLDIERKAPLYTQLLESMSGLATIRAFEWEEALEKENWRILDESQRPVYLLYALQRWLSLAVDLQIAVMAMAIIMITVFLRDKIGPGYMGVALVNLMAFAATVKALVTSWVHLEVTIGSVARIKNFVANTESENMNAPTEMQLDPGWPLKGALEFQHVSASYATSGLVLKDVSFSVRHGEKVGICGRTGSGKSTLVSCMLRMMDITNGRILVDSADITTISPSTVRSNLVGVPQEVFLFENSTLRLNIDPHQSVSDQEILSVLDAVRLGPFVQQKGGLDALLDANVLSEGEKQLLALARAMVRKGNILILDEVSSVLDDETTSIIDAVIRTHFRDWTVICIAHKIESIMQFDKVIVLDAGQVVEMGCPRVLRDVEGSVFGGLCRGL